jgi:RES domain-containing protein
MIYTAGQPATAVLETLVHVGRADLLRVAYVLFRIRLDPGAHLLRLPADALPDDWQAWPWPSSTQDVGTFWFDRRPSVVLEVPSAVVPAQRNYLVNPQHAAFGERAIDGPEPFPVDTRLGPPRTEP